MDHVGIHVELAQGAVAPPPLLVAADLQDHLMSASNAHRRLRSGAYNLARDAGGSEDEDGAGVVEAPPLRPNPVTQSEMDAGSVDLF